jgi:B-block binding subunit of TFIIIC
VPNLNYKLLSCISRAREAGIAQPDAARETQQDPRSLFSRTKMLVELGLMSRPSASAATDR